MVDGGQQPIALITSQCSSLTWFYCLHHRLILQLSNLIIKVGWITAYNCPHSSCVSSRSSANFKNTKSLPKLTFRNTSEWSSFSLEIVDPAWEVAKCFLEKHYFFWGGNYDPRDHTIIIKLYSYERLNNTHFRFEWR